MKRIQFLAFFYVCMLAFFGAGTIDLQAKEQNPNVSTVQSPEFDAATIKPWDLTEDVHYGLPGDGDRVAKDAVSLSATVRGIVSQAYGIDSPEQVLYGPLLDKKDKSWISSDTIKIYGKISKVDFDRMRSLTKNQKQALARLMVQNLLAKEMHLKVHFEMREIDVFDLVIAKEGKLPPPIPANQVKQDVEGTNGFGGNAYHIRNMTLDSVFKNRYFGTADRPIINKTGLNGVYNLDFNWKPGHRNTEPDPENGPSFFTALKDEWGLKLVPAKGQVQVLVIDSIEHPSAN